MTIGEELLVIALTRSASSASRSMTARTLLAMAVSAVVGTWGLFTYPVSTDDIFPALIQLRKPVVFDLLTYGYATCWFTTPFLVTSLVTSVLSMQ